MTVFYFTATGNSLYIAKRLGGNLISIPKVLNLGESAYNDDAIGIVYPCYAGGFPRIVKRFLDKVTITASYTFAIMTYGAEPMNALVQMEKHGMARDIRFDYLNKILMVDNYLPMFEIEKELAKIPLKGIENAIETIINDVRSRKSYIPPTGFAIKLLSVILQPITKKTTEENADKRFTVDRSCTLCRTCVKVCPVNNVAVSNGVTFHHQCEGCLACIHNCPAIAIHIKGEKSTKRFRNENIELNEIIIANGIEKQSYERRILS